MTAAEFVACNRPGPDWMIPVPYCIKPAGHRIIFRYVGKRKRKEVVLGTGHLSADGRVWPIGSHNMEFA